jgi:hypothetical protein
MAGSLIGCRLPRLSYYPPPPRRGAKDLVHNGRSVHEHGTSLLAVDLLCHPGAAGVADQIRDPLDGHAAVGHDADELWRNSRGAHLPPILADSQIRVNDRLTFRASSGVAFLDMNTSPSADHISTEF